MTGLVGAVQDVALGGGDVELELFEFEFELGSFEPDPFVGGAPMGDMGPTMAIGLVIIGSKMIGKSKVVFVRVAVAADSANRDSSSSKRGTRCPGRVWSAAAVLPRMKRARSVKE